MPMPSLSDLLGRIRQSAFGTALERVGGAMGAMLPTIPAPLTPDQLTPRDAQNPPFPTSAELESQVAAREGPPSAYARFMSEPIAHKVVRAFDPNAVMPQAKSRTLGDLLSGQAGSPSEFLGETVQQAAGEATSPGFVSGFAPLHEALVPFGLKPFANPEAAIKSSFEHGTKGKQGGIAGNVRRAENRSPEAGAPNNPRTEIILPSGKHFVAGENTPADTMLMTRENSGSDAQIWEDALWYDYMSAGMATHYDAEQVAPYKLAFAVTQARNGPKQGIGDVLIAERLAGGRPEPSQPSGNPAALAALMGTPEEPGTAPTSGIGQKLAGHIQNFFGKKTRTEMEDRPEFGAPVSGDRHVWGYNGFVHTATKEWLRNQIGDAAVRKIKLDTPNDPKYVGRVMPSEFEYLTRKGNELADAYNEAKFAGHDDWTVERAQASAWAAWKRLMGDPSTPVKDMFAAYYAQIPLEMAWGEGSPLDKTMPPMYQLPYKANRAINNYALGKVVPDIAAEHGVRVIMNMPTEGAYEGTPNPNSLFTLFGTNHAIQDTVDAVGHVVNQTANFAYHTIPLEENALKTAERNGREVASHFDITAASPLAATQLQNRAFLANYAKSLADIDPRFNGYHETTVNGQPTLRILNLDKTMTPRGVWGPEDVDALDAAADKAARLQPDGFNTSSHHGAAEVFHSYNDWKAVPDGAQHLSRFSAEGRSSAISRIQNDYRDRYIQAVKEGYGKYAPAEWDAHFGAPDFTGEPAGAAGFKRVPVNFAYKPETLGTPSSPGTFSQGWILPDGQFVQVPAGGTHQTSLAAATGLPLNQVTENWPALAAKGNMIRAVSHMRRQGLQLIVEIVKPPTDAQMRALGEWNKANQSNHLYDDLYFGLTDPLTKQSVHQGTGLNTVRRAIKDTNFDVPF